MTSDFSPATDYETFYTITTRSLFNFATSFVHLEHIRVFKYDVFKATVTRGRRFILERELRKFLV